MYRCGACGELYDDWLNAQHCCDAFVVVQDGSDVELSSDNSGDAT